MNADVVILAGGFGTRLQTVVKDLPKPMAPVNGKPFLAYILKNLYDQKISKVILAVGYKASAIEDYFGNNFEGVELVYVHETEPLGTGGGITNALNAVKQDHFFVLNGDTFFNVDLQNTFQFHNEKKADVTLCLKQLDNTSRYGTVILNNDSRIVEFNEKKEGSGKGYINAGVYLFNTPVLRHAGLPKIFSVEKDFFEKKLDRLFIAGKPEDAYFIDIGIPEDYNKANEDFKKFD